MQHSEKRLLLELIDLLSTIGSISIIQTACHQSENRVSISDRMIQMKRSFAAYGLALLIAGGSALAQDPSVNATITLYGDVGVDANTTTNVTTIVRCKAQEVSQGQALWTLLVLGIGSVVQRPGSLTLLGHQGLYRLAPELGVLDAFEILILIFQGVFTHNLGFLTSLKAVFALRHCLGKGQSWWLDDRRWDPGSDEPDTVNHQEFREDYLEYLAEVLNELQEYNHARLIGTILNTIAFVKACTISGSIRTNVLAGSLFLPFAIIDLLSWLCLRVSTTASNFESNEAALRFVDSMALLDPFKHKIEKSSTKIRFEPAHQRYSQAIRDFGTCFQSSVSAIALANLTSVSGVALSVLQCLAMALCLQSVFWPICVPWFLMIEFQSVEKGHWVFTYLTSFVWFSCAMGLWISVEAALFIWSRFRKSDVEWLKATVAAKREENGWKGYSLVFAVYVGLKATLIFRLYLTDYTGQGTQKPNWVDWLG